MAKSKRRVIATDAAGIGLIILSALTGWLPGPGGIPLFFAGLNRLAVNHEKPRAIQNYLLKNGTEIFNKIFPDHKLIAFLWDILSAVVIGVALYAFFGLETAAKYGFIISLVATALFVFAYNRRRYIRAKKKLIKK